LDHDGGTARTRARSNTFNGADNVHAFSDLTKHNVLAIEPRGLGRAQEELASVGIGTGVGHTQDSSTSVLQLEVLIRELVSVDRFSTSTVVVGEVTACVNNEKKKETGVSICQESSGSKRYQFYTVNQQVDVLDTYQSYVPWHMNPGMTLWKDDPPNPNPFSVGEKRKKGF
jgi:hypothetical protein